MAEQEVLAVIRASMGRRVLGVGVMAALGVLLVYVSLTNPPQNVAWQVFLIVIGVGALWMAERMRRATMLSVEVTRDGLRSSTGEMIAPLETIEAMDRGMFAFKPSNGFLLKLKHKTPARWEPGLWWRLGNRVGIGGVTPGSQAKAAAEILAALMAERQA